jgi:hypothetical protein
LKEERETERGIIIYLILFLRTKVWKLLGPRKLGTFHHKPWTAPIRNILAYI